MRMTTTNNGHATCAALLDAKRAIFVFFFVLANLPLAEGFLSPPVDSVGLAVKMTESSMPFDEDSSAFDVEAARRRLEDLIGNIHEESASPSSPQKTKASPSSSSQEADQGGSSIFNLSFFFRKASTPIESEGTTDEQFEDFFEDAMVDLSSLEAPLRVALSSSAQVPLTAMEIERREMEIELLRELENGDEVTEDIWNLWYHEKNEGKLLIEIERFTSTPATWEKAEDCLRDIIVKYGLSWIEPLNRLATLYYMQGRLHESQQLCELILHHKPWHFGALSGIVMVHASLNESYKAREWASLRMPSWGNGHSRRRQAWVDTAVEQARAQLEQRQEQGQQWWGPTDEPQLDEDIEHEDAWQ
eukprot:CAMPEP_0168736978 /NCGR_PEP_ID=MMETSP0724-20121128/10144_1 /TAXON_ID=265536 /ORGANISM="Amphiprora sp., Strain CCMP467" /LENGTH=359 /DNA_ID=CAMNT_0008784203 /DNA_START=29 /DNA_END=1108 /DNA_ORIENTATION=+